MRRPRPAAIVVLIATLVVCVLIGYTPGFPPVTEPMNPNEKNLVQAMKDPTVSMAEISRLITELPADQGVGTKQTWIDLAADESLEDWRRLASIQLLLDRCIRYPQPLQNFLREVLEPLDVSADAVRDMTIAQNLPLERVPGESVRMALLPISTAVGPAAVYFAVGKPDESVERAAVYPRLEQLAK